MFVFCSTIEYLYGDVTDIWTMLEGIFYMNKEVGNDIYNRQDTNDILTSFLGKMKHLIECKAVDSIDHSYFKLYKK